MIAALYVEKSGAYFGLPDVDPMGRRTGREAVRRPVARCRASALRQVVTSRGPLLEGHSLIPQEHATS